MCEVARRYGVAQSLLFTWRRQARTAEPNERDASILLPVEIGAIAAPSGSEDFATGNLCIGLGLVSASGVCERQRLEFVNVVGKLRRSARSYVDS